MLVKYPMLEPLKMSTEPNLQKRNPWMLKLSLSHFFTETNKIGRTELNQGMYVKNAFQTQSICEHNALDDSFLKKQKNFC